MIFPHLTQYLVSTLMALSVSNHNVRLLADNFLDPHVYSKNFLNNKPVFHRNLTFSGHVSLFSTGGQDGYTHTSRHT